MADEIAQPVAPFQTPSPAAVTDSPVAATPQAVATSPSPTTATPAASSAPETVSVSPTQTAETPKTAETAPTPDTQTTAEPAKPYQPGDSLLSDAKAKGEVKPAEAPKTEASPEGPKSEAVQAQLPTYDNLVLPEGVKFDNAKVGDFDKILGKFEVDSKADHAATQSLRQALTDFYIRDQQETAQRIYDNQVSSWNQTRDGWKQQFREDPDIGGSKSETTLRQCGALIENYGQQMGADREGALRMAFRVTGAGDHPELIRFMNWASNFTVERARPVAALGSKPPVVSSRAQRRYGNNGAS